MKKSLIAIICIVAVFLLGAGWYSATNFDRLVLGSGNYGEDPNPTADITGANDEYISNSSNGSWNFGAADLTTTGSITGSLQGDTNSFQRTPSALGNNQKFYDTVTVTGATTTSAFIVCPRVATTPVAGDLLSARGITDKMIVSRADTTTLVEPYSWLKVK